MDHRASRGGALRGDLLPRDELALRAVHDAPATDRDAPTVDAREAAPYLDHLAKAREVFIEAHPANERRSLAASPVPEVSPPPSPPPTDDADTRNTDTLNGQNGGPNGFADSVIVMFVVAASLIACACAMGCVWLRSLKEHPRPLICPVSGVTLSPRTISFQSTHNDHSAPKNPSTATTTTDREGPDPIAQPPMPHAAPLPPPASAPASLPASLPGLPPASTPGSTPGSIMRAERLGRARAGSKKVHEVALVGVM